MGKTHQERYASWETEARDQRLQSGWQQDCRDCCPGTKTVVKGIAAALELRQKHVLSLRVSSVLNM